MPAMLNSALVLVIIVLLIVLLVLAVVLLVLAIALIVLLILLVLTVVLSHGAHLLSCKSACRKYSARKRGWLY